MWLRADGDRKLLHRWKRGDPGTGSQSALRDGIERRRVGRKWSFQGRIFDAVLTLKRVARLRVNGCGVGRNPEQRTDAIRLTPIAGHREDRSFDEVLQGK